MNFFMPGNNTFITHQGQGEGFMDVGDEEIFNNLDNLSGCFQKIYGKRTNVCQTSSMHLRIKSHS